MRNDTSDKKEFVLPVKNTVQVEQGGGNIFFESGGEFILPDYMPKVQKVLRMEARVLPPSRYMGAGEAQMSGSVLHTLMYIGEEGEINATVLPAKYEFTIPFAAGGEAPTVSACVEVDALSYRLGAPRKLNIRTRLRAKPRVIGTRDIAEKQTPGGDIAGLHKLWCEMDGIRTQILRSSDITVSDAMDIGGGVDTRPIWCGSTAAVHDVRVVDGGVSVRGEACVKVLLDDGGKAKMVMKKLPFEEFLDGDVQKGSSATAIARVISTEAGKEQDGEALVDVVLSLEAAVDTPCRVHAVKDAFSECSEGRVEYRNLQTNRLLCNRSAVYTVGGSVAKGTAGAAGLLTVLDTSGEATVEETALADGKLLVNGRCALNTIFTTEDGELASAEYTVPFKVTMDCETPEGASASVTAALISARARTDGDDLVCDMDIAVSARAVAEGECAAVGSIDFTSPNVYTKSAYPLCLIYPRGESLWNVAKKYHVSPETLVKVNALSIGQESYANADALSGTSVLMLEL
ncbi:MAG: DUF3794 domain-containing protein [Clostridia bacterium]|nr:DUF3794 domain-containing protein [Clostridia bacterium]